MELVKLKKQPCPRSKELTGQQTAKMIRFACFVVGFWPGNDKLLIHLASYSLYGSGLGLPNEILDRTIHQSIHRFRHTAVKPQERMKNIKDGLRPIGKDEYAKAFGISIEDKFKEVGGR